MPSARSSLGALRRGTRYRSLAVAGLRHRRPVIAYVGWTGEGNLGDEAMYAMHKAELGLAGDVVPIPIVDSNPVLRALGQRIDAICLGGGTLIANGFFRQGLTAVMSAAPHARRFMIGPGSESLDYTTGRRADIADEFARWPSILAEFDTVRVRGPLSVEALRGFGVAAEHSGDPALLLPRLDRVPDPGVIGINVGITDDQWGGDALSPTELLDDLIALAQRLGLRVRLVATTAQDHRFMARYCATHDVHDVELPPALPSVVGLLDWMAGCGSLVGMKLHALILAATQHVPIIALEYRPKCRDFMTTLGLEHLCFRTDQIDVAALEAAVREHVQHADEVSARIAASVDVQARALRSAFATELGALTSS